MNKLEIQISDTQNRALRKIISQKSAFEISLCCFSSCCLMFWVVAIKADSLKEFQVLHKLVSLFEERYVTVVNFQKVRGCKEWFVITKTKNSNQFWSFVQQRWSVCNRVIQETFHGLEKKEEKWLRSVLIVLSVTFFLLFLFALVSAFCVFHCSLSHSEMSQTCLFVNVWNVTRKRQKFRFKSVIDSLIALGEQRLGRKVLIVWPKSFLLSIFSSNNLFCRVPCSKVFLVYSGIFALLINLSALRKLSTFFDKRRTWNSEEFQQRKHPISRSTPSCPGSSDCCTSEHMWYSEHCSVLSFIATLSREWLTFVRSTVSSYCLFVYFCLFVCCDGSGFARSNKDSYSCGSAGITWSELMLCGIASTVGNRVSWFILNSISGVVLKSQTKKTTDFTFGDWLDTFFVFSVVCKDSVKNQGVVWWTCQI